MSSLGELVIHALLDANVPSSPRRLLAVGLVLGVALLGVNLWFFAGSGDPTFAPGWRTAAIAATFLLTPVALFMSGVILRREPEQAAMAWPTLLVNGGALAMAIAAVV